MQFGTDGVRGLAHEELTTEFAARLARAAALVLGANGRMNPPASGPTATGPEASGTTATGTVVIGGDTRESTPAFDAALTSGFRSAGIDVVRLGVVPTPLVAFEAQRRGAMGAMVSASHNPFHDNGIKLFARGGTKLSDDVERRIEAELASGGPAPPPTGDQAVGADERPGPRAPATVSFDDDRAAYAAHVLSLLDGRRLDGLRVVLDTANGAATDVAPRVLREAGADVIVVADQPNGRNINDGCGATHPEFVADVVRSSGADLGIALDGDADRLIAVDHRGDVVDGDHIIAICALDLRARGALRHDTVVVTVMTNLGFRLAMTDAGIRVVETGVGDRYVLEALGAGDFSLGGEQSGHVIFADHATTGDGLLTAVALLDIVARSERPLADLAGEAMTSLPQVLVNLRVADRVPDIADRLADEIASIEEQLGPSGRVLVRPSGTEPLVRVMVEAPTADQARTAAEALIESVRLRFT